MKIFDNTEKNTNEFAKLICKLDGAGLIGLTRLLQVKVFYDDVQDDNGKPMPRSGEAIIVHENKTQRRDNFLSLGLFY